MASKITSSVSALDWSRWWPAPAKLNLCLHILGQRADGYHELETIFQILDLHDLINFTARTDGKIVRTEGKSEINPDEDLVVRAAHALRNYVLSKNSDIPENCSAKKGVSIRCRKRIPLQGGMGGGSSDAATSLLVLNKLWECGLSQSELIQLATKLGADVPVFVAGHSAYARGIGEKLEAIDLPESWFIIVKPDVDLSTQKIFTHSGLTRDSSALTIHGFFELLGSMHESLPGQNDCQKVVCEEYAKVAQVIDWLDNFGPARLTGTGSCVFLPCRNESIAKAVFDQIGLSNNALNWQLMIAKGLNESPLHKMLKDTKRVKSKLKKKD